MITTITPYADAIMGAAQAASGHYTFDQVLSPYIWVFYGAFIVAFCLTPVMQCAACSWGITDKPDGRRKLHGKPIPYLGGVAVFLAWLAGLLISRYMFVHRVDPGAGSVHPAIGFSIIAAAFVVVVLGLCDDIWGVRPLVKVAGQVIAASILMAGDVGSRSTESVLSWLVNLICQVGHYTNPLHAAHSPAWFGMLVIATSGLATLLVIVGACNATNLMDGMDGLCGGVTAIIAAGFLFICIDIAMSGFSASGNGDAIRLVLGLAALGAVLGFTPYNFNPASIFMGDTGSMFLGFSCGVMMLLMAEASVKWFLAAMVIFALPVLDTTLAFARRWIAHRPLFSADSEHFHHQLLRWGLSVKKTVLVSYSLALGFASLGVAMVFMRTRYAVAFYLVIFGSLVIAAYKMGMVHERRPQGKRRAIHRRKPPLSAEDFAIVMDQTADQSIRDLLAITWETASRQELLFRLEGRHVDMAKRCWVQIRSGADQRIRVRRVHLSDKAFEIVGRLRRAYPDGPLLRDASGQPWSADSCAACLGLLRTPSQRKISLSTIRNASLAPLLSGNVASMGVQAGFDRPTAAPKENSNGNGKSVLAPT